MSDYISREAAITAVKVHCPAKYEAAVIARIVCVPAADVIEVRHGRWVAESYYAGPIKMWGWKCTACGAFSYVDYKFCPSCMARMDESEDKEPFANDINVGDKDESEEKNNV